MEWLRWIKRSTSTCKRNIQGWNSEKKVYQVYWQKVAYHDMGESGVIRRESTEEQVGKYRGKNMLFCHGHPFSGDS